MNREEYLLKPFLDSAEYINRRTDDCIEKHRKDVFKVKVLTADGRAVQNAQIKINQTGHEFKIGANIFMLDEFETEEKNAIYREMFPKYFNLATVPFYWDDIEPIEGQPRYSKDSPKVYRRPAPDLCLEYLESVGVTPKAHCLNYDRDTPPWLNKYSKDEQWQILEKRYSECAERYRDRINGWEVTNETFWNDAKSPKYYDFDYVERSFMMARRHFPENQLIINEDQKVLKRKFLYNRDPYFMQVERALLKGAPIDTVGFQYHVISSREHEKENIGLMFDPENLYRAFDTFSTLGKKLQMTEITVPCFDPFSKEDADLQAEVIKWLYTLWFGIPNMEAIIYWNTVDGYAYQAEPGDFTAGQNKLAGGLLHFDLTPKPALNIIHKLFNEVWHTELETNTENGETEFKGFYGTYDITVEADGIRKTVTAAFSRGGPTELEIIL